jgi:hypothetical protein
VPEVNPYTVLANPRAGNFHIVWHLPQGAHFNPAKGDGIFLKNDDQDQFSTNYATDDQAGFPSTGKKGKNYHWQFDNSKRSQYQYLVRFRMGTTVYECDPLINNEGG